MITLPMAKPLVPAMMLNTLTDRPADRLAGGTRPGYPNISFTALSEHLPPTMTTRPA